MTSTGDDTTTARRAHDSEASRRALLDAGRALFVEVGYERATTRDIGERAGVDPALIARYFGGKEGLYLAAIAEAPLGVGAEQVDFEPHALIAHLLERWDERGHSPVSRALASPALTDDVRELVCSVVGERLVEPLIEQLRTGAAPQPELRAELLIALALGVSVTRANGTLAGLARIPRDEVVAALDPIVAAIASSGD
ncbi:MAG TPA: TetR family transcriptional regulator [Solirubrobacterales bacterium]|nr:TetR family transcriptional regulator [Solirubrobacterales bacterium]